MSRRYGPENLVVAAAGRLDHDEVVELTRHSFAQALKERAVPAPPQAAGAGRSRSRLGHAACG